MKILSKGNKRILQTVRSKSVKCDLTFEMQAMVNLMEAQEILLHCHADHLIDNEGFILFYDLTKPANPEFPYWTYPPLDLEKLSDDEYNAELLRTTYTG